MHIYFLFEQWSLSSIFYICLFIASLLHWSTSPLRKDVVLVCVFTAFLSVPGRMYDAQQELDKYFLKQKRNRWMYDSGKGLFPIGPKCSVPTGLRIYFPGHPRLPRWIRIGILDNACSLWGCRENLLSIVSAEYMSPEHIRCGRFSLKTAASRSSLASLHRFLHRNRVCFSSPRTWAGLWFALINEM